MKPREFVTLAKALAANPDPASRRSSVSRAYYGAFKEAERLLNDGGYVLDRNSRPHEAVSEAIDNTSDAALMRAAEKLKQLKKKRVSADYYLTEAKIEHPSEVTLSMALAEEIISELDGIRTDARRLSDAMAKFQGWNGAALKFRRL